MDTIEGLNNEFIDRVKQYGKSFERDHVDLTVQYKINGACSRGFVLRDLDKENVLRMSLAIRRIAVSMGFTDVLINKIATKKPGFEYEEPTEL